MALDPAWVGVVGVAGTAIGAAVTGLIDWAKTVTLGRQQRKADAERRKDEAAEAKAVRECNAAEKLAQWEHDSAEAEAERQREAVQRKAGELAALRAERVETIRHWREGLAASHTDYEAWDAIDKRPPSKVSTFTPEPNIVSAPWFQSLRPYIAPSSPAQKYRDGFDIQCDREAAGLLSAEIAHIESSWGLDLD